jgi:cysteinyl-tRNA synthetase
VRACQERISGYDVYYAVRKFPDYGQLSGCKLEELEAGASGRVGEEGAGKRDPFDFALWKAAPPSEPGFESPWGWGRPGWHIECSAMVRENLGDHIDIHAGGADLIFPHHENELAQSEPITGKPLAKYWLHNGFVNVNGEKMSKSLGNFTTLRQALALYHPMALRLFLLQTHYRSPIDLTEAGMQAASRGWETLEKGIHCAQQFCQGETASPAAEAMQAFQEAMDDDFGTPGALALAFELAKELIREHNLLTHEGCTHLEPQVLRQKGAALLEILATLGFCWTQPATAQGSEKGVAKENWPSFHLLKMRRLRSWWPNARQPAGQRTLPRRIGFESSSRPWGLPSSIKKMAPLVGCGSRKPGVAVYLERLAVAWR